MPKFAHINPSAEQPSRVFGWFDTDVLDYPKLPQDLLELTQEQWEGRQETPFYKDGALIQSPPTSLPFADVKANKLAELNALCDEYINAIRSTYPETEVLSWPKQEAEARALQADPSAPAALLRKIAAARGMAVEDLATRVLAKSDAFAAVSGAAFGKRQRLEAQIEAATTVEQIAAINWSV